MTLRLQIQPLRQARGWTQEELAERAGLTRAAINRLERGRTQGVTFDTLERLARVLGVEPGLLIVRVPDSKARG